MFLKQSHFNRDENVDKFQVTLRDELEKAERDSQMLRDLEKELVVCVSTSLKKLSVALLKLFFLYVERLVAGFCSVMHSFILYQLHLNSEIAKSFIMIFDNMGDI